MRFNIKTNTIREYCLVAMLLLCHFFLAFTSLVQESPTFDETVHVTGGFCFWKMDDYRINPENGNFPQRWAAIPLLFDNKINMPVFTKNPSLEANEWLTAYDFLFKKGNSPDRLFVLSRSMMVLLSLLLGLIVYCWSKKYFGIEGAALSLLLYVFCPTILAHSRLVTSDIAATLCFIGSAWTIWYMLEKITLPRVLLASLWLSFLFLAKMSAFLIIPMYLIMIAVRLKMNPDLEVEIPGRAMKLVKQSEQLVAFLAAGLVNALIIVFFIWMSFGFRYSMLNDDAIKPEIMEDNWQSVLKDTGLPGKLVDFARQKRLLPEAYLFGFQFVLKKSEVRYTYLNGEQSLKGWWYFFPYACLVKTPLPVLGILTLLMIFSLRKLRKLPKDDAMVKLYPFTPLIVLALVYLVFAIASSINIGHRHVLVLYPVAYIFAGACWLLFRRSAMSLKITLVFCFLWIIVESFSIWPHYLAYFNQLAGGPQNGYRHLVDSSLDWGQDLKGLGKWLKEKELLNQKKTNVYVSYFGIASIDYYAPGVKKLPSYYRQDDAAPYVLRGGVYCISATMLPFIYMSELLGQQDLEGRQIDDAYYADLEMEMKAMFASAVDKDKFMKFMTAKGPENVTNHYQIYSILRFAKLARYLETRKPDDNIGYSILIYKVTDEEVAKALKDKFSQ
ncbi:MAG TPA: hypothetical protein DCZ94_10345 [Lentisphaeria bacterium]|nr:MAG: hypothetical protein A2X48_23875 [Lentisphaerae bacterium GWF2_49_21]HBC87343.1 hypothetical protein [Lentisphaeria bacterium]